MRTKRRKFKKQEFGGIFLRPDGYLQVGALILSNSSWRIKYDLGRIHYRRAWGRATVVVRLKDKRRVRYVYRRGMWTEYLPRKTRFLSDPFAPIIGESPESDYQVEHKYPRKWRTLTLFFALILTFPVGFEACRQDVRQSLQYLETANGDLSSVSMDDRNDLPFLSTMLWLTDQRRYRDYDKKYALSRIVERERERIAKTKKKK